MGKYGKVWESMGEYGSGQPVDALLLRAIRGVRPALTHAIYCRKANACLPRDGIGKCWESMGEYGKVWENVGERGSWQPVDALPSQATRWVISATHTHDVAMLAAMHPKTPKLSQTFPILPTKAANYPIARKPRRSVTKPGVCGVVRHPPTPEASEDKPAAHT